MGAQRGVVPAVPLAAAGAPLTGRVASFSTLPMPVAAAPAAIAAASAPQFDTVPSPALAVLQDGANALNTAVKAGADAGPRAALDQLYGDVTRLEAPAVSGTDAAGTTRLVPSDKRLSSPAAAKSVRRMMLGSAAMKSGMETVTLSIPLLALTALGGASMVAALVVAYGISQAVFASAAGSLADRFPAHKVLAGAIAAQAALVGVVIALGAAGALSAGTLLPLYILIGGAVGIAETTRHSIPALILGQNGEELSKYNARLHIAYEIAGVTGALAAGALIGLAGPLWSLLLQPPAYLLAAYFFLRARHARPTDAPATASGGVISKLKAYASDVKAGASLVLGDGRLRWVALAFVLPQIVHRVFESLLIPVFAKTVLQTPEASAWLLTASNLGELLGAVVLLKFAARFKGPAVWINYGALGLLLIWALASTTALPLLLPLILISSLTWAASDLSLRSELQSAISEKAQPRALSFLYGAFVLGSAATSFALGAVLDALGMGAALYWICGGITALTLAVYFASRRLKR